MGLGCGNGEDKIEKKYHVEKITYRKNNRNIRNE